MSQDLTIAACGSTSTLTGPADLPLESLEKFNLLPEGAAYVGGSRFDANNTRRDESWSSFGGHYYVLPAVELKHSKASETSEKMELAVNMHWDSEKSAAKSISDVLEVLRQCTSEVQDPSPSLRNIPAIVSKEKGEFSDWRDSVVEALNAINKKPNPKNKDAIKIDKIVLARKETLTFNNPVKALNILLKLRYSGHKGYFLFLSPHDPTSDSDTSFIACTPERLFKTDGRIVETEALAGTRPRSSDPVIDKQLEEDLIASTKDYLENEITKISITEELTSLLQDKVLTKIRNPNPPHVRKLSHVQHICHEIEATVREGTSVPKLTQELIEKLHPTPAVCGEPRTKAAEEIRSREEFDRGLYAGPFGYISATSSEITVAIRSALVRQKRDSSGNAASSTVTLYAGAGIVNGSTPLGEWDETSIKMQGLEAAFNLPYNATDYPNVNIAWAEGVVEELLRCGVSDFIVCPGSRSSPLTVAVAWAASKKRLNAISVVDERSAGFVALGIGRATRRPVVVITSSGTAVANLHPAVVEASVDGVPLIVLTADRPYENRDTGANQAIDQVKIFGSYVRWFRDILPPSCETNLGVGLADLGHAYNVATEDAGPVHVNVQFRENLSPDGGEIRNSGGRREEMDGRQFMSYDKISKLSKWPLTGEPFVKRSRRTGGLGAPMLTEVQDLIKKSKRGAIVVGNLRKLGASDDVVYRIMHLAETLDWPVFASIQAGGVLRKSGRTVKYAESVLKGADDVEKCDLVLQFGSPVVGTAVSDLIKTSDNHVLVQPLWPGERLDPFSSVTHMIDSDVSSFLSSLSAESTGSEFNFLVSVGEMLQKEIQHIVRKSIGESVAKESLTEPQIFFAIKELVGDLFLSNSMPIRDADSFLYGAEDLNEVGANRGASGIDGVVSSAVGFSSGLASDLTKKSKPTTLVIGDVATVHDLSAIRLLKSLVVIVVNNDGGGIFNFLPIAKHGEEVEFEKFFGTPTNDIDFKKVTEGLGVSFVSVSSYSSLKMEYRRAMESGGGVLIEANVVGVGKGERGKNVDISREINAETKIIVRQELARRKEAQGLILKWWPPPPAATKGSRKTVVLLHGFMGGVGDWDASAERMRALMGDEYSLLAVSLPGHGAGGKQGVEWSVENMAEEIAEALEAENVSVEAVVGYSLGGRVALALKKLLRERKGQTGIRVALLSANMGRKVTKKDQATASKKSIEEADIEGWLERWYGNNIWGDLKERKREKYESLLLNKSRRIMRAGVKNLQRVMNDAAVVDNSDQFGEEDLFLCGGLDTKYKAMGDETSVVLERSGHAVLLEDASGVATAVAGWLSASDSSSAVAETGAEGKKSLVQVEGLVVRTRRVLKTKSKEHFAKADIEERVIWEIEVYGNDGKRGIGEVSPLKKLHVENVDEVEEELKRLSSHAAQVEAFAEDLLDLRSDALEETIKELVGREGGEVLASVRAGLEQALLMLASESLGRRGVAIDVAENSGSTGVLNMVTVNRLWQAGEFAHGARDVMKIKLGGKGGLRGADVKMIMEDGGWWTMRGDANRQWETKEADVWAEEIGEFDMEGRIEYVEEPASDLAGMKRWSEKSGIKYALDETVADLVAGTGGAWGQVEKRLNALGEDGLDGCAAVILKPSLLGFAMSYKIANFVRQEWPGVEIVFTSCFEGSVGLAHLTWLAGVAGSDGVAHGLGTHGRYQEMEGDNFVEEIERGYGSSPGRMSVQGATAYLLAKISI
ncbi:hypothetical protein TrVE_jg1966 [Triparma verrucosa]|uniref:isochorismate synthase n=1 Tax=Triparma verrucosa TaxID=1606542 RepID=A0A9W7BE25_9STRA|nr:hypothetical protein TrVE_jg1966 [Triparma verrucosa]